MKREIEINDLTEFQTAYKKDSENSKITQTIKEKGIKKAILHQLQFGFLKKYRKLQNVRRSSSKSF